MLTLALDCVRDGIGRLSLTKGSLERDIKYVLLAMPLGSPLGSSQGPQTSRLVVNTHSIENRTFFFHTVAQAATATFTYVSRWSDPTDWPFNEPPISTDQTWIPPGRFACRTAKLVASAIGHGF